MYGYIYKTTDLTNNKIYIGQKKSNIFLKEKYVGSGLLIKKIKAKCKKDGIPLEERFKVELVEWCSSRQDINIREPYWIRYYNSTDPNIGYNIAPGGADGGPLYLGHKHSEETKRRMSENRIGTKNSNYGNHWHHTKDMKYRYDGQDNPMWGKTQSKDTKEKIRKTKVGKEFYSNKKLDDVKLLSKDQVDHYVKLGYFKGNIHARVYKNK